MTENQSLWDKFVGSPDWLSGATFFFLEALVLVIFLPFVFRYWEDRKWSRPRKALIHIFMSTSPRVVHPLASASADFNQMGNYNLKSAVEQAKNEIKSSLRFMKSIREDREAILDRYGSAITPEIATAAVSSEIFSGVFEVFSKGCQDFVSRRTKFEPVTVKISNKIFMNISSRFSYEDYIGHLKGEEQVTFDELSDYLTDFYRQSLLDIRNAGRKSNRKALKIYAGRKLQRKSDIEFHCTNFKRMLGQQWAGIEYINTLRENESGEGEDSPSEDNELLSVDFLLRSSSVR